MLDMLFVCMCVIMCTRPTFFLIPISNSYLEQLKINLFKWSKCDGASSNKYIQNVSRAESFETESTSKCVQNVRILNVNGLKTYFISIVKCHGSAMLLQ